MELALYLYSIVSNLKSCLGFLSFISGTVWLFLMIYTTVDPEDTQTARLEKMRNSLSWFLVPAILLLILLPDQKGIAMIYIIPKIVESTTVQQDVPELYEIALKVMKKNLQESIEGGR